MPNSSAVAIHPYLFNIPTLSKKLEDIEYQALLRSTLIQSLRDIQTEAEFEQLRIEEQIFGLTDTLFMGNFTPVVGTLLARTPTMSYSPQEVEELWSRSTPEVENILQDRLVGLVEVRAVLFYLTNFAHSPMNALTPSLLTLVGRANCLGDRGLWPTIRRLSD